MKKVLLILSAAVCIISAGCSKNEDESGFSAEERSALEIFTGTFTCRDEALGIEISTETFTFEPFASPRSVINSLSGIPMDFSGSFHRVYRYGNSDEVYETDCYFYLSTTASVMYSYQIIDEERCNGITAKSYDYQIIDPNTIRLHDRSLSLLNWYTYIRE